MEWLKAQLVKILAIICVLQLAAIVALLLGKGVHIDRHVENHQNQQQYQGQLSITVIPDHLEEITKEGIPYTKVCSGQFGYKSVEDVLSHISPANIPLTKIDDGCVYVPNFYKQKKKK